MENRGEYFNDEASMLPLIERDSNSVASMVPLVEIADVQENTEDSVNAEATATTILNEETTSRTYSLVISKEYYYTVAQEFKIPSRALTGT